MARSSLPLLMLLVATPRLTACGDAADDCGQALWYQDADGDGYGDEATWQAACEQPSGTVAEAGDCDDGNASANPGVTENWYDGYDQDCDGADDYDQDGDGHGVDSYGGDDCNDNDPTVNPDAADAPYDGIDSNCDDASDYDVDEDGHDADGYGGGDCDDHDPAINPSASEIWYDGVDQDCDGASDYDQDGDGFDSQDHLLGGEDCDDDDPDINPHRAETWYDGVDSNCDGANDYDLDLDGYESQEHSEDGTDCDDSDPAIHPGAFDWHDGEDNDCDGSYDVIYLDSVDAGIYGEEAGDQLGSSVAIVGDIDGDGHDDLAAGGPWWPAGLTRGAAWIVLGPVSGELDLWYADARITGAEQGDRAGYDVAAAGDVDGDGFDDLLMSASEASSSGEMSGSVYLLRGPLAGDLSVEDADAEWQGEQAWDLAGSGLAGGADLTGDGSLDLVAGSFEHDDATGAVYLLPGTTWGTNKLEDAAVRLDGEQVGDGAGVANAMVGDTDGDGFQDLLVGAYEADDRGSDAGVAYLLRGPVTASGSLGQADVKLLGEAEEDYAGFSVAPAGDTNADGYDDLLVGAPGNDTRATGGGAAYLVLGPLSTDRFDLGDAEATFGGDQDGVLAGTDAHGAGDFDGDGYDDIAVGAPNADLAATNNGAVFLVLGPAAGSICSCGSDVKLYGVEDGTMAGAALGGGGDVNGDGYDDLLIGAPGATSTEGMTGGAFLLLGTES